MDPLRRAPLNCVRILSFFFFSFFLVADVSAQTGRIEGRVLISGFDQPISGANVRIEGTKHGAASAGSGAFRISGIAAGTYTLVTSAVGYRTAETEVEVPSDGSAWVVILLDEQPVEIDEVVIERVSMTGGERGIADLTGSAHYISPQQLEKQHYSDIHRILREIPGINTQEEEGFGLRPHIGIRGAGTERTSKVAVMEDGILAAPAPYTAPAAYYFPTAGRMQAVEVRKGSSQIKYGPLTTGGAINLISTQIPQDFSGRANLLAGEHGSRNLHAYVGDSWSHVAFLLESYHASHEGFKQLDGGGDTGFRRTDVVAKLRFHTRPDAAVFQSVMLKAGIVREKSDETYLGLTESDFAVNPFRRYAASQFDVLDADHMQLSLRHVIRPADFLDVTTTLYRNDFSRNWYKLDRVAVTGSAVGIGNVLNDPLRYASEYSVLVGSTSADNSLVVRSNNRSYKAQGIQSIAGIALPGAKLEQDVEIGVRYHYDEMDRFQWDDFYGMDEGVMLLTARGVPGTESNRVEWATALATYVQYRLRKGALTVVPGLRYENIRMEIDDYGKDDVGRTGFRIDAEGNRIETLTVRTNHVDVLLPGIGADLKLADGVSGFGGIHRGFAPPGATEGAEPESSVNYELGIRGRRSVFQAQAVLFYSDYGNLLGSDLTATGGTGTGAQFNGGAARVGGVELSAAYNLGALASWRYSVPLRAAYTFTHGEFRSHFESTFGPWSVVNVGDEIPYMPRHQLSSGIGFEHERLGLDLNARYVSTMRTTAGRGKPAADQRIDGYVVFDLSGELTVNRHVRAFASVRNLTDEIYIAARRPAGLRPGLPRTIVLGLKTSL